MTKKNYWDFRDVIVDILRTKYGHTSTLSDTQYLDMIIGDSLDKAEFRTFLETETDIDIPDDKWEQIPLTVKGIGDMLVALPG